LLETIGNACTEQVANIARSGERVGEGGRGRERENAAQHTHGSARDRDIITKGACTRNNHIAFVHLYCCLSLW